MKSLTLYQQQYAALHKDQRGIVEDMAQLLAEGREDGFKVHDIMDPPKPSPSAPEFDL